MHTYTSRASTLQYIHTLSNRHTHPHRASTLQYIHILSNRHTHILKYLPTNMYTGLQVQTETEAFTLTATDTHTHTHIHITHTLLLLLFHSMHSPQAQWSRALPPTGAVPERTVKIAAKAFSLSPSITSLEWNSSAHMRLKPTNRKLMYRTSEITDNQRTSAGE